MQWRNNKYLISGFTSLPAEGYSTGEVTEEACKAIAKDYGVPVEGTEARTQYDYLWSRRRFMRYGEFRRKGMFIGSGPIESACRTDVARRCKQSGMHWRIRNASSMCALVSRIRSRGTFA